MSTSKPIDFHRCEPPTPDQRRRRLAAPVPEGGRASRYSLPKGLESHSPVGYRTRLPLTKAEAAEIAPLYALERPKAFVPGAPIREQELFEECSLGILTSRQSTNFRGHRQVTLGPEDSKKLAELLRSMKHLEAPVLDNAQATHVVLTRPYRTPFTLLLTFVGHLPLLSLLTVPWRGLKKRCASQARHCAAATTAPLPSNSAALSTSSATTASWWCALRATRAQSRTLTSSSPRWRKNSAPSRPRC